MEPDSSPTSQDITYNIVAASSLWQQLPSDYLSLQLLGGLFVLTIKQIIECPLFLFAVSSPSQIVTANGAIPLEDTQQNVIYSKWTHHW